MANLENITYRDLEQALEENNVSLAVAYKNELSRRNDPDVNIRAVALIIRYVHMNRLNHDLLMFIGPDIVADRHKKQRINILAHLPDCLKTNLDYLGFTTLRLTNIIMESDEERYLNAIRDFAQHVFGFAVSFIGNGADDLSGMECLRYLEKYIKPTLEDMYIQGTNKLFIELAPKMNRYNMNHFMKVVMCCKHYSYYGLMAALTHAVDAKFLNWDMSLKFMKAKHKICSNNEQIGPVNKDLADKIEVQFILAHMRLLSLKKIETMMSDLKKYELVTDANLEEIAKLYIEETNETIKKKRMNRKLGYFTEMWILTKYYKKENNSLLKQVLEFRGNARLKNRQKKTVNAIVATLSYPKSECVHAGSDEYLKYLLDTLMKMIESLQDNEAEFDLNSMQNILFCLHNLYSFDQARLERLRQTYPDHKKKMFHVLDMLTVASSNWCCQLKGALTPSERLRMSRENTANVNTSLLLLYVLGNLQRENLKISPYYLSPLDCYKEYKYTDSLSKPFMIKITMEPYNDRRVIFVHRREIRYAVRPVMQDDEDSEDDESGVEATTDEETDSSDSDESSDEVIINRNPIFNHADDDHATSDWEFFEDPDTNLVRFIQRRHPNAQNALVTDFGVFRKERGDYVVVQNVQQVHHDSGDDETDEGSEGSGDADDENIDSSYDENDDNRNTAEDIDDNEYSNDEDSDEDDIEGDYEEIDDNEELNDEERMQDRAAQREILNKIVEYPDLHMAIQKADKRRRVFKTMFLFMEATNPTGRLLGLRRDAFGYIYSIVRYHDNQERMYFPGIIAPWRNVLRPMRTT